ncbi:MAG: methyltransferase domain-containing protein [Caldilineaceae bacterium]
MEEQAVVDSWDHANPYEQYVGRWSRQVAPRFLAWLALPAGQRWLDLGCGTGALCAAIVAECAPAAVTGVEPSAGFLVSAQAHLADQVTLYQGSATAIPLSDAAVDVVVAGLMLNFVPDQQAALTEMMRVTATGGTVAAYVWDYGGTMELMSYFWDAAVALDPVAAPLHEATRFPGCQPEALAALFDSVGLHHIACAAIDIATPFTNFDDYWQPFLGGQGPAPSYAMALDPAARARLREQVHARLPIAADGSITLAARAWAVSGVVGR